jgi:hypothetical protein
LRDQVEVSGAEIVPLAKPMHHFGDRDQQFTFGWCQSERNLSFVVEKAAAWV